MPCGACFNFHETLAFALGEILHTIRFG